MGSDGTWDRMRAPGFSQPWGRVGAHHKGVPAFSRGTLPHHMPGRRRLATRDAVHDSPRLTRHNGEQDGSRMVAEEALRIEYSPCSKYKCRRTRELLETTQQRRHRDA
eukprot:4793999-Prymnesium_polylepis.1